MPTNGGHCESGATQLATVDQVSGGRLAVVAGSGWLRSEFEALGVGDISQRAFTGPAIVAAIAGHIPSIAF